MNIHDIKCEKDLVLYKLLHGYNFDHGLGKEIGFYWLWKVGLAEARAAPNLYNGDICIDMIPAVDVGFLGAGHPVILYYARHDPMGIEIETEMSKIRHDKQ